MACRVHGNKKDCVSHGGLKTTDFVLRFCQPFLFEIQTSPPKIQKSTKIIEITMMITRCCQMANGKGPPMATTPIKMLCLIV
jgi:hypothetical protein